MTKRNGELRLYHYTHSRNLFGIHLSGLLPSKYDPPSDLLTMGQPVVWLTTQTTLAPTPADLEYLRARRDDGDELHSGFAESTLVGRDTRLPVNVSTLSKKLVHWYTWLSTTNIVCANADNLNDTSRHLTGRKVLEMFPPSPTSKEHYWIYFGTIRPARIELQPTSENMLPGIEDCLASAIKEGEANKVARFTELRDQIKALPFGTPINFNVQDEVEAA
jgi:hypothetical protein